MCVTNDEALAKRMSILRVHGMEPKYYHSLIGGNFRIDEIQAAVLNVKLKALDEWTTGRQRNARYYDNAFKRAGLKNVITPAATPGGRHIYNQYVIRVQRRDELRKHLAAAEIGCEVYYPVPLHQQECFAYLGYKTGQLPESERAAAETLALPIFPELSAIQLQFVVDSIASFHGGKAA
jgi:dTDP-4-amino-4,6-dideoxygalactose transaminase